MRSTRLPTLGLLSLLPLALCVQGCAGTRVIAKPPSACSSLVPDNLWAATPGTPFPKGDDAKALAKFGDGQTAQLDQANRDKGTAHHVITNCEARDAETFKHVTRPWWAFWR